MISKSLLVCDYSNDSYTVKNIYNSFLCLKKENFNISQLKQFLDQVSETDFQNNNLFTVNDVKNNFALNESGMYIDIVSNLKKL